MTAGAIIGAIAISNVGAWIGCIIGGVKNQHGLSWWKEVNKPRWNPPDWSLGIIWTAWYSGMGYASYLVYRECGGFTRRAALPLAIYSAHLLVNWSWVPVFLRTRNVNAGLVHIVALDAAAVGTAVTFGFYNINAVYWMLPYLTWMIFDTTLMYTVWSMNRGGNILKDKD